MVFVTHKNRMGVGLVIIPMLQICKLKSRQASEPPKVRELLSGLAKISQLSVLQNCAGSHSTICVVFK